MVNTVNWAAQKTYKADFRLICATNRDLMKMVDDGLFRPDLYFRINGFPVYVPALRERRSDIVVLVHNFISDLNKQYGDTKYVSDAALAHLQHRDWMGNVRELKNTLERWYVISPGQCIDIAEPEGSRTYYHKAGGDRSKDDVPILPAASSVMTAMSGEGLKSMLDGYEKAVIEQALQECKSTYELAEKLKISQPSAVRRLQKYGLSTKS